MKISDIALNDYEKETIKEHEKLAKKDDNLILLFFISVFYFFYSLYIRTNVLYLDIRAFPLYISSVFFLAYTIRRICIFTENEKNLAEKIYQSLKKRISLSRDIRVSYSDKKVLIEEVPKEHEISLR